MYGEFIMNSIFKLIKLSGYLNHLELDIEASIVDDMITKLSARRKNTGDNQLPLPFETPSEERRQFSGTISLYDSDDNQIMLEGYRTRYEVEPDKPWEILRDDYKIGDTIYADGRNFIVTEKGKAVEID
jgi:hypothetical protein